MPVHLCRSRPLHNPQTLHDTSSGGSCGHQFQWHATQTKPRCRARLPAESVIKTKVLLPEHGSQPKPTPVLGTGRPTRQATDPRWVICWALLVPAITWLFGWHILQDIVESTPSVRVLLLSTYILETWFYTSVFVCVYWAHGQPCYWLDMGTRSHDRLISIRQALTRINIVPCRFK